MKWWDAIAIGLRLTLSALKRTLSVVFPIVAISGLASGIGNVVEHWLKPGNVPQTFEEKITALTRSLNSAAGQVSEIEQEIARRKLLAEQLQRDADLARKISTLNAEQVAAVSQALRGELHAETRSEFWGNAAINALFALLGAVFGEIFRIFREWRRARVS